MEGYAVSAQCMALVRDNCLIPTKDAPELGYVRESTDKQYVPDVFYKVCVIYIYNISQYNQIADCKSDSLFKNRTISRNLYSHVSKRAIFSSLRISCWA